jgi:hypothetical protein
MCDKLDALPGPCLASQHRREAISDQVDQVRQLVPAMVRDGERDQCGVTTLGEVGL